MLPSAERWKLHGYTWKKVSSMKDLPVGVEGNVIGRVVGPVTEKKVQN